MWLIFIILGCICLGLLNWYGNWEYYQSPCPWKIFITIDPAHVNQFEEGELVDINDYTAMVIAKHYDNGVIEIQEVLQ